MSEFIEIQKTFFCLPQDPEDRERSKKSLTACLEAVTAFQAIMGLDRIAAATPRDCERFQHKALKLPKNWRVNYRDTKRSKKTRKLKEDVESLSPNTVHKWSVALQAAFERANRNATKKCIRSVVPEEKLLSENPWKQFRWIKPRKPKIRQYHPDELISVLDFFDEKWPAVAVAPAMTKTFLWSSARKLEIAGLQWDYQRIVGEEIHFDIVGKWGIRRWFRIPKRLHDELLQIKMKSPFVFAAYGEQLRRQHESGPRPWLAEKVRTDFDPVNLAEWFYNRIVEWSDQFVEEHGCVHTFRKTMLQHARRGEDVNRQVAADAGVSEGVMMTYYVTEEDEELRQRSNRTFQRIAASLSSELALRYGYVKPQPDPLQDQLQQALAAENWELVQRLTSELAKRKKQTG